MWPINHKIFQVVAPTTKANNETVNVAGFDRAGWHDIMVVWHPINIDVALTLLRLDYSDDDASSGSTWTALTGSVFATAEKPNGDSTVLPTSSDAGKSWIWYISKARHRHYRVTFTIGNGSTGSQYVVWAQGFAPDSGPFNDVARGGVAGSFLAVQNG